jgi:transposase
MARFSRLFFEKWEDILLGNPKFQNRMFFVPSTEERLSGSHPLRAIKRHADEILKAMHTVIADAYSVHGRPSIPPEAMLKALLLQALYSIPSKRRLVDAINWNLLYRWFCDLEPNQAVWDASTFTHNRERFERYGLVQKFFQHVVQSGMVEACASNDHFTVNRNLIQSWASRGSFDPSDQQPDRLLAKGESKLSADFHGDKRECGTHPLTPNHDGRLEEKNSGMGAQLFPGMRKRWHGLRLVIRPAGRVIQLAAAASSGTSAGSPRKAEPSGWRLAGEQHRRAISALAKLGAPLLVP